jgi:FkbM family methyltransferase
MFNQQKFIDFLNRTDKESENFSRYKGSGFKARLKRLCKYNFSYIGYSLDLIGLIESDLLKNKYFLVRSNSEFNLMKYVINTVKEDDVFYDVGANIGLYTRLAELIISNGEIHSFEPVSELYRYLKRKFTKNNIFINNYALGNKVKNCYFLQQTNDKIYGGSTLIQDLSSKLQDRFKKIEVRMITLDSYIKNHQKPTFLKLDVEGSESLVIEGGKEFLKNNSPIIAMEIWSGKNGEKYSYQAALKLYELGYKSYRINKEDELEYFSKDDLINFIRNNNETYNFIFKKS